MTPTGLELPDDNTGKGGFQGEGGAESGALDAENNLPDPDLQAIIDAWPALPETVRAGILAMVKEAGG